jgi:uncharacterized membrane protein
VDDPDYYLDVYVGRLPASTTSELDIVVDKIISYENNTDWSWYKKFAIAALNLFDPPVDPEDINEGEYSAGLLTADLQVKGYSTQTMYESLGQVSSSAIINAINGGLGLISMIGHGTYNAWGNSTGALFWHNSNIASLNNGVKLPVGHQASCLTAAFDNDAPSKYPGPSNVDGMAEEFVKKQGGAHIANYGYSRVAYGGKGTDHPNVTSGYMNSALFNLLATDPITTGKAFNDARNDCLQEFGLSFVGDFKHAAMFTLIGDPSTILGGVGLTVTATPSEVAGAPGENAQLTIKVKNTGPYTTTAIVPDLGQHLLDPGQFVDIPVFHYIPMTKMAGEKYTLNFSAESSVNGRRAMDFVEVTVDEVQGINFTVEDNTVSVIPGGQIIFEANLVNGGNDYENILLTFDDIPDGWSGGFEKSTLPLDPYGANSTNITIEAPEQVEAGNYTINVTASIQGAAIEETIELVIQVLEIHGIAVTCVDPGEDLEPGGVTGVILELSNEGNVLEPVNFIPVAYPDGWIVLFKGAPAVMLEPYDNDYLTFTVFASQDALVGSYPITIRFNSSQESVDFQFNVTVKMVRGMEINIPLVTAKDGEATTVQIHVNNTGNVPEAIDMEYSDVPENWEIQFDMESFDLVAFGGQAVNMEINVPAATAPGVYYFDVVATTGDQLEQEAEVNVTVLERVDGSATLQTEKLSGKPGDSLRNTVVFENTGNVKETVSLSVVDAKGLTVNVEEIAVSVDTGTTATLDFRLKIPGDATVEGTYSYVISVQRTKGDSIELNGTVEILRVFGVDIKVASDMTFNRKVTITNTGNSEEAFAISLKGTTASWATPSENTIVLAPGKSKNIFIEINPPGNAQEGRYKLEVVATSSWGDSGKEDLEFVVTKTDGGTSGSGAEWAIGAALITAIVIVLLLWFFMRPRKPAADEMDEETTFEDIEKDEDDDRYRGRPSDYELPEDGDDIAEKENEAEK